MYFARFENTIIILKVISMIQDQKTDSPTGMMLLLFVLINAGILEHAFTVNETWYWALIFTFPVFIGATIYHKRSRKVNIRTL